MVCCVIEHRALLLRPCSVDERASKDFGAEYIRKINLILGHDVD